MILRRDPETQRLRVELSREEQWRFHASKLRKATLVEADAHLFRAVRP
jgi:hypothetical protein